MTKSKLALGLGLLLLVVLFFVFDLGRYLSLDELRAQQAELQCLFERRPLVTGGVFFLAYVAVTGMSLPGATVLTLAAGAIFGLLWGTVLVSFASTLGATLAFLASRYLFKETVQRRFGDRLKTVNRSLERDGPFYLFAMRLVPVIPFFAVNALMGLTPMRTWTFAWVSQVGMLVGTAVYVNAGTQLAKLDSLSGIMTPAIIGSFVLLALFPFLAKKLLNMFKARRVYAPWSKKKPKRFDTNILVIGAGSGGLVSAYIAAAVKAKVSLVERDKMGGDCLNTGCVPSKALLRSAKFIEQARKVKSLGLQSATVNFEFSGLMERVQRVIKTIEPHDSVERYTELGVDCVQGTARMLSPWEAEVVSEDGSSQTIAARSIIIATGARPFVPPIPGLEDVGYLTSDNVWDLRELPERLVVLGGGPIGSELAQAFARIGAKVTQVEMQSRIMMREDPEVSEMVAERLRSEGIDLRLDTKAVAFALENGEKQMTVEHNGQTETISFDKVLVAVGRQPRTEGYGLEELGIPLTKKKTIEVNDYLQTKYPNVFAVGDVVGPYQFTHTAAHTAWYATVNALFGWIRKFPVDYSVIPWATFTAPEVARVGLNELEAEEQGVKYEVTTYGIDDLDRAIADEEAHGLVKVLTVPGKDRVLGVTIVSDHAGDLIAEYVLAMKNGIGLNKILQTIHIYPTMAEANKYVAGNWKKAHVSARVLSWLKRLHSWRLN